MLMLQGERGAAGKRIAPHKIVRPIALFLVAILAGRLLWHARHCTGPTQADVCPLAGSKAATVNTNAHTFRGVKQ